MDPAWIVTAPPNYSPDLVTPQTMYDVIRDTISNLLIPKPVRPSFSKDILPLLRQCVDAQWVNAGFFALFGWKAPNEFLRQDYLLKLSAAPGIDDPFKELRRQVYYSFRDPNGASFDPLQWPPLYGDAFGSFDLPPGPREGFAVTKTLYRFLGQWAAGDFDADYDAAAEVPKSLEDIPEPGSARHARPRRVALLHGRPFSSRVRNDMADATLLHVSQSVPPAAASGRSGTRYRLRGIPDSNYGSGLRWTALRQRSRGHYQMDGRPLAKRHRQLPGRISRNPVPAGRIHSRLLAITRSQ